MSGNYRGTTTDAIYKLLSDFRTKVIPGWYKDVSAYDLLMNGKASKLPWDPRSNKLTVGLDLAMKGAVNGFKGTDTSRYVAYEGQKYQGASVNYDWAGFSHALRFDLLLKGFKSADPSSKDHVVRLLAAQWEAFQHMANIIMTVGYNATVCEGVTIAASGTTATVAAGNSVQNLYKGLCVQQPISVADVITSGVLQSGHYGIITRITKQSDGSHIIYFEDKDGTANPAWTHASTTTLHIAGCYQNVPYGFKDFITKDNTIGDLDRSTYTEYNPIVYTATELGASFISNPARTIVDVATEIERNSGVKIDMACMCRETENWFFSRYQDRIRKFDTSKKALTWDTNWGIDGEIGSYRVNSVPQGQIWLFSSDNLGISTLPDYAAPDYVDADKFGQRVSGTLDSELIMLWGYQMYMLQLAGAGAITGMDLTATA